MPAFRVPASLEPNAWAARRAARLASGAPTLDLTLADPTRTGLAPIAEAARALAHAGLPAHAPDPRGTAAARRSLAATLSRRAPVEPDDLVLTASTSEAYAHLFRLLAGSGGAVLVPTPSYPLFAPIAQAEGVELRTYPLRYDGAWHVDRGAFAHAAGEARAVVVVEPNHPTGCALEAGDHAFIREQALARGMAVLADEVFGDHPWEASRPLPTWLGEADVPVFVLGGLSKLCGLPQLKLAWIAACGPEAARREALRGLEWLADLFLSVAAPVQAALPELLDLRHAFASRVRERVRANLARLDAFVREHPSLTRLPAEGGWTALLRLSASRTDEAWALALLERGVAVHPGHFYDLEPGEHLVLSLIVEPGTMAAGLEALGALVEEG